MKTKQSLDKFEDELFADACSLIPSGAWGFSPDVWHKLEQHIDAEIAQAKLEEREQVKSDIIGIKNDPKFVFNDPLFQEYMGTMLDQMIIFIDAKAKEREAK